MAPSRICKIERCGKPARGRGLCKAHHLRFLRHGDPLKGGTSPGAPADFLQQVVLNYDGDDCLIWPYARLKTGYAEIRQNGRTKRVHRVVCEAKNGPPPTPEHDAAHSCGHGSDGCCNPRHVRWATGAENEQDKVAHGTSNRGERQGQAKLTRDDVRRIRALRRELPHREIAEMFGVNIGTIRSIYNGQNWAWLE